MLAALLTRGTGPGEVTEGELDCVLDAEGMLVALEPVGTGILVALEPVGIGILVALEPVGTGMLALATVEEVTLVELGAVEIGLCPGTAVGAAWTERTEARTPTITEVVNNMVNEGMPTALENVRFAQRTDRKVNRRTGCWGLKR